MVKTLLTALFAVVLVLVFSTITVAQDNPATEQKKEEAKEMMKDKSMKMDEKAKKMEAKGKSGLMSVTCDPACGFRVTSHDEAELTGIVKTHAKTHHQKDMTDAEVKGMMKPASWPGMPEKKTGDKKEESKPHDH